MVVILTEDLSRPCTLVARRLPPPPARFRRAVRTPISAAVTFVNVAAFVLLLRAPRAFSALTKDDVLIRGGQVHRMVSSCFLHGGIVHLGLNMQALRTLGPEVEEWFGHERFAGVYLLSGVSGNALSLATRTAPLSVGASGAIFGLLGAWYSFLQQNQQFFESRGVDVSRSLKGMLQANARKAVASHDGPWWCEPQHEYTSRLVGCEAVSFAAQTCALNAVLGLSPHSRVDNWCHCISQPHCLKAIA
jgi:membrane associated rhomboid family serine protease